MLTQFRIHVFLALIGCLLFAPIASAGTKVHDKDRAHVYIGKVDASGAWQDTRFDGLPTVAFADSADIDVKPIAITASQGCKLRKAHFLTADVIGRLPAHSKVHLLRVHVTYGYVWGEINTEGVTLLSVRSPHIDGETGRSGSGPTPSGLEPCANLGKHGNHLLTGSYPLLC